MAKNQLKGKVISNKMKNTVVVEIERLKKDKKYKRRYSYLKSFKAHDQKEECKIGDEVIIEECRPISKDKKWRIVKRTMISTDTEPEEVLEEPIIEEEPKVKKEAGEQKEEKEINPVRKVGTSESSTLSREKEI
jgi:small subunit ribosomal protein S17